MEFDTEFAGNHWIDLGPHIVSGVIDNSEKGKTTAELVIDGLDQPLQLELQGNAGADLAGCVLKFTTGKSWPLAKEQRSLLISLHHGVVGVITASVKRESWRDEENREFGPVLCVEWINLALLETFVFERGGCQLEIDLPRWTLTAEEIERQQKERDAAKSVICILEDDYETEDDWEYDFEEGEPWKIDGSVGDEGMKHGVSSSGSLADFQSSCTDSSEEANRSTNSHLVPLDDELRKRSRETLETVRLLQDRYVGPATSEFAAFVEDTMFAIYRIIQVSPLDWGPNGEVWIDPADIHCALHRQLVGCESQIRYLEMEATFEEKKVLDRIWCLREQLKGLISLLESE